MYDTYKRRVEKLISKPVKSGRIAYRKKSRKNLRDMTI